MGYLPYLGDLDPYQNQLLNTWTYSGSVFAVRLFAWYTYPSIWVMWTDLLMSVWIRFYYKVVALFSQTSFCVDYLMSGNFQSHTNLIQTIDFTKRTVRILLFIFVRSLYTHAPVADLKGGARDAPPASGPKFLHFHAVFGKNWPNNMLYPRVPEQFKCFIFNKLWK